MAKTVDFSQTKVTGGFWKQKQDMIRKTTIYAVYDRFVETGRFDAFQFNWKEGQPNQPHIFWDSDVAKWMEAAAYLIRSKREPKLEKIEDGVVEGFGKVTDKFVEKLFAREGESVEDAKQRLNGEKKNQIISHRHITFRERNYRIRVKPVHCWILGIGNGNKLHLANTKRIGSNNLFLAKDIPC